MLSGAEVLSITDSFGSGVGSPQTMASLAVANQAGLQSWANSASAFAHWIHCMKVTT